jgi:hypothetical protein
VAWILAGNYSDGNCIALAVFALPLAYLVVTQDWRKSK